MSGNEFPVMFNEWLKRRRRALDMTQEELAKRAACSVGALRKIESGDRRPSKQLAALLAEALEIPKQEQPTFIRVARGELNLERLQPAEIQPPTFAQPQWIPTAEAFKLPPPQSSPQSSSRIPLEATPLIGRTSEFAALERLFNDPQCRLITLTGVGGVGKTRLAVEFASCRKDAFPGGVYYVPLTSVNSPAEVVPALGDVLNFGFSGPIEPKEQLIKYLSGRMQQKTLLVLDNLEHLLIQGPDSDGSTGLVVLISELLQRLPEMHILATSRERLNLHGEWTYELHGLSVPPALFAGQMEEYNAIALFMNTARRVRADFQAEAGEQVSMMQICRLVDGIPLAIELAAAWVDLLTCQEIAQEIRSNMDFLSTKMHGIPERHRSIRATFDHSWSLLSSEERRALCQLSVFHGGFDRQAAQQVAGASLPLLASLSAKSLIRREEGGRYSLHEVIRQYALSHLNEPPGDEETYQRHCEYYLSLLGSHEKSLKTASQQEAVHLLMGEIDNIRLAWAWAVNHKKYTLLEQAGRAYGWYFEITGLLREGIEQLELLVKALNDGPVDRLWHRLMGMMYLHQALLSFREGSFEPAIHLYEEAIVILRPIQDQFLLADALVYLGTILHTSGEYDQGELIIEEGLALAQESGNRWIEALAIFSAGYLASMRGQASEGYVQMQAGMDMWGAIGDPGAITLGLNFKAPTLIKLQRYAEAKNNMLESIALCELTKNRWGLGTAYRNYGLAALAEGQYPQADSSLLKSIMIYRECSTGWDIARTLTYLGDSARHSGNAAASRAYYLDAYRISIEANTPLITMDALFGLSSLLARAGCVEPALLLCFYVINNPCSEGGTKSAAEQLKAELEAQSSPAQVAAARAAAAEKTLDEIYQAALS